MTIRTLIRRSLRFHWRSHLGVVIGAAIGSAALVGALAVGDSVKGSLRAKALERLGAVHFALSSGDRLFRDDLVDELQAVVLDRDSRPISLVPALLLQGPVVMSDASARANQVNVIGIEDSSWGALSDGESSVSPRQNDEVWLNEYLKDQLGASEGDLLLVRIPKSSALSQDAVLSSRDDATVTLRLRVAGVQDGKDLGNFSLHGNRNNPGNLFVTLGALQEISGRIGGVNTLLAVSNDPLKESYRYDSYLRVVLSDSLSKQWQVEDAECELIQATNRRTGLELKTSRIFLDPPIEHAALVADTNAQSILTYIANLITSGTNTTPYSMVTAAGEPWTPKNLQDDEIVLNQWLADDLQVEPGDVVTLVYYDPESGGQLTEHTNTFRVHSIVPMEMPWADRTLMPDFPGIEKAESTADWDTAFPLTYKIRPKDDDYWQQYRGTPKAFITLAAGKQMWANRFGELTAIRFPVPSDEGAALTPTLSPGERENRQSARPTAETARSQSASTQSEQATQVSPLPAGEGQGERSEAFRAALERKILSNLDPAELGLRFEPVREQALKAAEGAQDFGGLFIGFSLFLIAAALILMALLFQFGLEQRSAEVGTLLALGFTHKKVRRLLLGEGATLAFIGGVIGVVGGVFYSKAMLLGLTTVWKDAVGATSLKFFVTPGSLAIGLLASTVVAVLTIWLALRKQARRPARDLLAGSLECGDLAPAVAGQVPPRKSGARSRHSKVGWLALAAATGLVGWAFVTEETTNAGVFFGAGALVLIGGLALTSWGLRRLANVRSASHRQLNPNEVSGEGMKLDLPAGRRKHVTFGSLALRGLARRRSRSVATAALLACGSFLILSIGVFRLDADRDATERTSGTGGFALIGESTIPVVHDLNSTTGREFFAFDEQGLRGVDVVQFRVRVGDDASCLNLNRAQKPRLMGVKPESLNGRFTFAKVAEGLDAEDGWGLLESEIGDGRSEIAAIGDLNSILWAMGKKVGDTIDYVDGRGRPFGVRIVGAVANSILQGNLIIDEAEFLKRFPDESGYQYFLMDAPLNREQEVSGLVSRTLQDYGMEVMPAARRLNQFNAVQNTYLGTFQILGGLGLLLGSAGLGIVVLRNVLERRGELAVLMAVGFRQRKIERLVLMEHAGLLGLGLAIGLVAAAVAVLPTMLSPGSHLPYATLVPTVLAVLVNGLIWTWAATRVALRGNLLKVLRNE